MYTDSVIELAFNMISPVEEVSFNKGMKSSSVEDQRKQARSLIKDARRLKKSGNIRESRKKCDEAIDIISNIKRDFSDVDIMTIFDILLTVL